MFFFLLASSFVYAQDSLSHKNLVIVSFNTDMFNNQASKAMLMYSGMSYNEMVEFFNQSLIRYMDIKFRNHIKTYSLSIALTTNTTDNLYKIWSLQSYLLSPIPKTQKRNVDPSSFLATEKQPKGSKGELVQAINSLKGNFLDSKINDKKTFSKIFRKLYADYVLIINELDIKEDYSNPYSVGSNDYSRQLQVHFTLFDNRGNKITGNVATIEFSSQENNIKEIATKYFPMIADKIRYFIGDYIK